MAKEKRVRMWHKVTNRPVDMDLLDDGTPNCANPQDWETAEQRNARVAPADPKKSPRTAKASTETVPE